MVMYENGINRGLNKVVMSLLPGSLSVLRLYKDLLRYGQKLQFTDKTYFNRRVRREFRTNRALDTPEDIVKAFEKGQALLKRRNVQ